MPIHLTIISKKQGIRERKFLSTESVSMSDVFLPSGYSGKARNLFKNSKIYNVLSAADVTSASDICNSIGSRSISISTSKLVTWLQMQTIVALKEFLTTVEEIICALIYSLEHKKCYAGFFLHSNTFDNSFKFRASNIQLYVFKKKLL